MNVSADPFDIPLMLPTTIHEPDFYYYIYDHLSNTRIVYSTEIVNCSTVEYTLEAVMDYYPYGKILRQYIKTPEKYVTTHHERDAETGLDYRGARFYDSDVARFLSLDPHASNYLSLSDYSYVAGNPVMIVDPDGKDNIIYVLTLEGVSSSKVDRIINKTEEYYKTLGIDIKLVKKDYKNFNYDGVGNSDAVAIIGKNNQEVEDYAKGLSNEIYENEDYKTKYESEAEKFGEGEGKNPESAFNVTSNAESAWANKVMGVAMGTSMNNFADDTNSDIVTAAAFTIVHSTGHLTGISHTSVSDDDVGFLYDGNDLIRLARGTNESLNSLDKIIKNNPKNEEVVNKMKESKFTAGKAVDNYNFNIYLKEWIRGN